MIMMIISVLKMAIMERRNASSDRFLRLSIKREDQGQSLTRSVERKKQQPADLTGLKAAILVS